jgi:GH18 family chitinase
MKLKEKNPALKILISCGGWGANGQFEGIIGSEEVRYELIYNSNILELF